MTFQERYYQERTWHAKVMVMEIFHLAMTQREPDWTLTKTAREFGVSVGLVSENLRLALLIHANEKVLRCNTRQDALRKLSVNREQTDH
jgi:hypothetical protein